VKGLFGEEVGRAADEEDAGRVAGRDIGENGGERLRHLRFEVRGSN
jgi:hypothetical protein